VVAAYPPFQKLTSVHVDAIDDKMLACGYDLGVTLYDLTTAQVPSEEALGLKQERKKLASSENSSLSFSCAHCGLALHDGP
jgi:hypothetical protein